jgi:hypothetical protein
MEYKLKSKLLHVNKFLYSGNSLYPLRRNLLILNQNFVCVKVELNIKILHNAYTNYKYIVEVIHYEVKE